MCIFYCICYITIPGKIWIMYLFYCYEQNIHMVPVRSGKSHFIKVQTDISLKNFIIQCQVPIYRFEMGL